MTDWLLGRRSEYTSRARLLHLGVVIALLATYLAVGLNFILGFALEQQVGIILSGLPCFLVYILSKKYKRTTGASVLFLISVGIIVSFSWFAKGGILGNTAIYFLIVPLLIFILPRKWKFPTLFLMAGLLGSLFFTEISYPELINSYPSENARLIDVGISFFIVFGLLVFGNITVRNELQHNRRVAEQRARQVERQKRAVDEVNSKLTKLFSIISHDLKTPLANIKSTLELMQDRTGESIEIEELIPKLDRDIGLTINMLDNLLSWSKQQLSGVTVEPETLNLSDSLEDTLKLVGSYADLKDVQLDYFIPDKILVNIDRESLKLVVRNLAINAVKYSDRKDSVTINCQSRDEYVQLNFVDHGVGIPQDQLDKLFELGDSRPGTNNEVGAGIGLYLCRTIIEAYHGSLKAQSKEGQGSTFTLRIPRGE